MRAVVSFSMDEVKKLEGVNLTVVCDIHGPSGKATISLLPENDKRELDLSSALTSSVETKSAN
jgi:hypothetical protein